MTKLAVFLIVVGLLPFPQVSQPVPPGEPAFAGYWLGTLAIRARELRMQIHITSIAPAAAAVTSIDTDNQAHPPKEITIEGRRLTVVFGNGARVAGTLSPDGRSIDATYEQHSATYPLLLKRMDGPFAPRRPQYPSGPLPYHSEEVTIVSGAERLAGTFTRPRAGGRFPAVLLISGSGPQDRDETVFGHKPFLVLSDYLTRRGIAVLRVDDRGAGASSGTRATATMEDWAGDARACVEHLASRADVDAGRIGLIGHSEGGIVAPLVASVSDRVAFLVLIGAPAMDGRAIALLQADRIARAAGANEDQLALSRAINTRAYDLLKTEASPESIRASFRVIIAEELTKAGIPSPDVHAVVEKQMEPAIQRGLSPWFRHFLFHDPVPVLRSLRRPVLAIYGALDVQVPAPENDAAMRAALSGGSLLSRVETLPALNHLMQTARTGAMDEYGKIEETFSPRALETIGKWIAHVTTEPRRFRDRQ